jgi:5-methylcytosine-specific restriction endonuclease McrA
MTIKERDANRKRAKAWYWKNRDAVLAQRKTPAARLISKRSRAKHRDKRNAERREWRLRNLDRQRQYNRLYFKTASGSAKNKLNSHKRRKYAKNGTLTSNEVIAILHASAKCAYCGCEFDLFTKPTIDHVTPLSRGGEHSAKNVTAACKPCNSRKKDKLFPFVSGDRPMVRKI